jgi:hypothetical protein
LRCPIARIVVKRFPSPKTVKPLRSVFTVLFSLCVTAMAFAGDPSGAWKWSITPPNGEPVEVSLKLTLKEGKLSGTYQSPFGEAAISKVILKDDAISFEVEREMNGNKFVVKYAGKLDGDAIKGTVELPAFDGSEPVKRAWDAHRVTEPKQK